MKHEYNLSWSVSTKKRTLRRRSYSAVRIVVWNNQTWSKASLTHTGTCTVNLIQQYVHSGLYFVNFCCIIVFADIFQVLYFLKLSSTYSSRGFTFEIVHSRVTGHQISRSRFLFILRLLCRLRYRQLFLTYNSVLSGNENIYLKSGMIISLLEKYVCVGMKPS